MKSVKAFFLGSLVLAQLSGNPARSAEPASAGTPLSLSPPVLELFRAEMRELLAGSQSIAAALPVGEWERIVETSHAMKASYILDKKLSPAKRKELSALPEQFLELDAAFHARTGKLAEAAAARDAEAITFHYGRLLEACVGCHVVYAPERFPALATPASAPHHH